MSAAAETIIVARTPSSTPTAPDHRDGQRSHRAHRRSNPNSTRSPKRRREPTRPTPPSGPPRARTGVFVAFVLAILTVGLLGMLWINTALAQGAFVLSDLQQQRVQLVEMEQQLREELALAEAPARVEEAARELGMVPQDVPVFLRLEDGQVLGNPIPQPAPIVDDVIDAVEDEVDAVEAGISTDEAVTDEVAIDEVATDEVVTDQVVTEEEAINDPEADVAQEVAP